MTSSKVTCLAIGDPHFKTSNVKESELFVKNTLQLTKEKKPDFIVVMGDVLDRHEIIHQTPLNSATNFLIELSKLAPLYILIGNHDRPNNAVFLTSEHPFQAMKYWSNTYIVEKPLVANVKGFQFTFVPYVEPGRFLEALNTLDEKDDYKKSSAIFAHQEFYACTTGPLTSTKGDKWSTTLPFVISGHIHDYQKLSNITYVGTPFQHAFNEKGDKSISHFTFAYEKELLISEERLRLNIPEKCTIEVNAHELEQLKLPSNSEIKLIIRGIASDIKIIKKSQLVKEYKEKNIKVVYHEIISTPDELKTVPVNKKNTYQSFPTILHDMISSDKELLSLFTELFGELTEKKNELVATNVEKKEK